MEEIKTKLVSLAMPFVFLIALSPLGISEDTILHEKVGSYNVSFAVPGEREFYYEIDDPKPLSGKAEYAGVTGTGYYLDAIDRHTGEYLSVWILRYNTPVAKAITESNTKSSNWAASNPIYGTIWINYNTISGNHAFITVDEYTVAGMHSNMSQTVFGKIAETFRIEEINVDQHEIQDRIKSDPIPAKTTIQSGRYPANKDTMVYHEPGCTWAGKIKPENLIGFNSPQEAEAAGYRHCKKCG